jgi:glucose/arabinose dehydrogenase
MQFFRRMFCLTFLGLCLHLFFQHPGWAQNKKASKPSPLKLEKIASGFNQITDIQFFPKSSERMVILEKAGRASIFDIKTGERTKLAELQVATQSELGLLGFAFHPKFANTKKVFLHYNPRTDLSRISEWTWSETKSVDQPVKLINERVMLEVDQPYKNHNGGGLAFGPDGFLYIGLGDGGYRGDPENRAQNLATLLGKMLRIDVDSKERGREYGIPKDNPFLANKKSAAGVRPEIFAYGLRNPWKYAFDNKGRLIAGDVGQNTWEEITFVPNGANLGWRVYEASHCYEPPKSCAENLKGHVKPLAEYGRELGASVTGGQQYEGQDLRDLKNRYFFGDFATGRIWSISLPDGKTSSVLSSEDFMEHGKFDIAISTFAKDARGELYVADFNGGSIFRLGQ